MFRNYLWAAAVILMAAALPAVAQDWTNLGGNAQRSGRSSARGPAGDVLAWSNTDDPTIISWHPVTDESRVFVVRENGFPTMGGTSAVDPIVCYSLATGAELWRAEVPFGGDSDEEWIAYIGGANSGRVYAARGGSGRTTPVYAFDATDGSLVWTSTEETVAGPQDGFVFAPNGDVLVGDFGKVMRLDASDGSTVWSTPRLCPVSGNCGVALGDGCLYFDEPVPGGNAVAKMDLASGAYLYNSDVLAGFTDQNAPFVSPDLSTVYFARSQNNAATDFLYAFEDTGTALVQKWHVPVRWTTSHEHGIGPDGSVYTFIPGEVAGDAEFVRLDPDTGVVLSTAGVLSPGGSPNLSPRTAVDRVGRVYVSNGWASTPASNGRVWAFTADLGTTLFTLNLSRPNAGGPSLAADGTLVMSDLNAVRAYRTPACEADMDGDGDADGIDVGLFLQFYSTGDGRADLSGEGDLNGIDVGLFLQAYSAGC